jgi:hypothetical protein
MPVPWFTKYDHSKPFTSSADEDALVLLHDAEVVCKQALAVQQRRQQQAPLKRGVIGFTLFTGHEGC